jgi:hypothetical protein
MSIMPTLKGTVADAEYTLSAKGQMTYSWLDENDVQLKAGLTEATPAMEAAFYANGIGQYLDAITTNCQLARDFDKEYNVTETAIAWGGNAGEDSTQGTGISDEGSTSESE